MEEPGGLPSVGLHRVGHNWSDLAAAAKAFENISSFLSLNTFTWKQQSKWYLKRSWLHQPVGTNKAKLTLIAYIWFSCVPTFLIQVLTSFSPPCLHNKVSSNHFWGPQDCLACVPKWSFHVLLSPLAVNCPMLLPRGSLLIHFPESRVQEHPSESSRRGHMMLPAPHPSLCQTWATLSAEVGRMPLSPTSMPHISELLRAV